MRLRRMGSTLVATLAVTTSLGVTAGVALAAPASASARTVWPAQGQAAYVLGAGAVHVGPRQHVAPIASMAKVMTAYLVLRRFPLTGPKDGFTLTVTGADVADRARRVGRGESTVPVARGERLTERQALAALLLPSANNVAIMLARRTSGSVAAFVRAMNAQARTLHMTRTRYTDPSGYDAGTTSTPADQLRIAHAATAVGYLRWLVNRTTYAVPVAGRVHNTDTLLRRDGFVGLKTGSDSAAGGCLMFRSRRVVGGRVVDLYGVVMGQRGGSGLLPAAFSAARGLVDRVAAHAAP